VSDIDDRLRERFGLAAFHPWQRDAVEELLSGSGHVLVVAPTGGGKSLCYQFPATELEGTTIVVSPLIALMEDQTRGLAARGIPATYVASNLSPEERRTREEGLARGKYRLVYVAPERLAYAPLVERLAKLSPPLVAIDEAHCISQWGHDFRPDYLRLGEVVKRLGAPRVLACTATATPSVRAEIVERLRLPEATRVVLRGFARPNLNLSACEIDSKKARFKLAKETLAEAIGKPKKRTPGAAILYAPTRRTTEELAAYLDDAGYDTAGYHAGMDPETRADVSGRFAARTLDVVVATNAFGMGIDRPDVRAVVHVQAPGSIEAYYQEVGRAGRDGRPALGVLISAPADLGLRRRLIERSSDGGAADPAQVERQWKLFLDLLKYVEAGSCRHDFILHYFGDEGETLGGCGHCDVCERLDGAEGGEARAVSEADALVVRKALSGIARNDGRAGLTMVAEMLHGSENERLITLGLSRLSTYGILPDRPKVWILALLRRLVAAGLVDLTPHEFPVPFLTAAGRGTMAGREPVRVLLPDADAGKPRAKRAPRREREPEALPSNIDADLFERLRAARMDLARAAGLPAYVIAHDKTLREIAARRPTSRKALAGIHGMGPARIEAYGERLLQVVRGG